VPNSKRLCILGTAPSWRDAPFDDPSFEIWAINDSWTLPLPRVDAWFDLHPLDHLYFRPVSDRVVYAEDVPHGHYVRPHGHLEKLQEMARTIPVWLQADPPDGWPPNAQRLPIEILEEKFGTYWASGPSYEIALALHLGFTEIHIYGIHLETEHEYREQRPNFEYLLGVARGMGVKVVMADAAPLLKHGWRYGYESKPSPHPAKRILAKARHEKASIISALAARSFLDRGLGLKDRLMRVQALEHDCERRLSQRTPVVVQAANLEA
jgi:hypothetical protein|tara:strand:- start:496 stop:1293 length:798 start_codon:yes stop_codon:yes gene_type:complete